MNLINGLWKEDKKLIFNTEIKMKAGSVRKPTFPFGFLQMDEKGTKCLIQRREHPTVPRDTGSCNMKQLMTASVKIKGMGVERL